MFTHVCIDELLIAIASGAVMGATAFVLAPLLAPVAELGWAGSFFAGATEGALVNSTGTIASNTLSGRAWNTGLREAYTSGYLGGGMLGGLGGIWRSAMRSQPLGIVAPGFATSITDDLATVYRVQRVRETQIITGGAFGRLRKDGESYAVANAIRNKLLDLVFSHDPQIQLKALQAAQANGRNSPFISTTFSEALARQELFALRAAGKNYELITLRGLRSAGVDFEETFASLGGRTKSSRFKDAELFEFGIPDLFIPASGRSKSGFFIIGRE